jgi:hypothetical protein
MPGEGGTSVGRIVGYLVLDKSDWTRGIEQAKAEARSLGRESPTVRIDVDSAGAIAKINAVDAAGRKAGSRSGGIGLLLTSILAIGPAAIPLAAGAGAAVAGIGAAGVVAALGILGIHDAMKQGTTLGKQYSATFAPIVDEFGHLKALAASNMFGGINAGVKDARAEFPQLNQDVGLLSTQLGQIVGHTAPGLLALFSDFSPLISQLGDDLVRGSAGFEHWATSGDGVRHLVAYLQTELPRAEQFVGQLADSLVHVSMAIAPLGGTSLATFGTLLRLFNLIPVGTLTAAAPAIVGVTLAIKGMRAVSGSTLPGLKGLNLGWAQMGPIAAAAGIGLGVLTSILGRNQEKQAQATAEINNYTDALKASHGAIDQNIRDLTAQALQSAGAFDAARRLGVSLKDVTDAALGDAEAMKRVDTATYWAQQEAAIEKASGTTGKHASDMVKDYNTLNAAIGGQSGELDKATQKARELAAASGGVSTTQADLKSQMQQVRDTALSETSQLVLLSAELDKLSGNTIDAKEQELHLRDAMQALIDKAKTNGHSLDENTAKGRANKEGLLDLIKGINGHAEAVYKQTGSIGAATGALKTDEAALRSSMRQAGYTKGQIDKLIAAYAATPRDVRTKVDADNAAAMAKLRDYKYQLDRLNGRIISVDIYQTTHQVGPAAGGHLAGADGGTLTRSGFRRYGVGGTVGGRGGPREDNQLVLLSVGEKVIPNGPAQEYATLIDAMIAGQYGSGGTVGAGLVVNRAGLGGVPAYARGGQVSAPMTNGRRSKPMQIKVKVELTTDSGGNMRAWVRDIVADEADYAATTARM